MFKEKRNLLEKKEGIKANLFRGITAAAVSLKVSSLTVFGDDIFARTNSITSIFHSKLLAISSGLAGVCLVITFLWMLISSSTKKTEEAKTWAIRIIIAYGCINLVPAILTFINEATAGL